MKTEENEPINPCELYVTKKRGGVAITSLESFGGLTKREYFAAMMMQGLVSKHGGFSATDAENAVLAADALIKELNK